MKEVVRFEISWQTFLKIFMFSLIVVVAYLSRDIIGVLFVAIVVSLGLDPLISFLERKKLNRFLATLFVYLSGLFVIIVGAYFLIPIFIIEASGFLKQIHDITYTIFGIGLPNNLVDVLTFSRDKVFDFLSSADISITKTVTNFLQTGVLVVATILISFFLSVEKDGTERLLRVILPDAYEGPVLNVFRRFKGKIRKWLTTQLWLSGIIGIIVVAGLLLLNVKYALIIGILAAVFELIPLIGPIVVGFIAFLVAASDSFMLGIYTIVFFLLIHQLENHILIPLIIGKTMKVHPVVVLISLLIGGKIAGFIGVILAVPIAVMAQEIFNYMSEQKEKRNVLEF